MKRWCIYTDILGFSHFWEYDQYRAITAVKAQIRAIFQIGAKVYPSSPKRLFVHQMGGDGLAIVSEGHEQSLERPIAIAVALLRHIATNGSFASAAIEEGDNAHVSGWYPEEMEITDCGIVSLGDGLMTLSSSVMGTTMIRVYHLNNDRPSEPFLTISENCLDRIPEDMDIRVTESDGKRIWSINWLQYELTILSDIRDKTGISIPSAEFINQKIKRYSSQNTDIRDKEKNSSQTSRYSGVIHRILQQLN